jgi:hypothetical protein
MTLVVAWIRNAREDRAPAELVVSSDSRLRFGAEWDCCPKVFGLPRSDALIAFAGDTYYAYPLLLQFLNALATHEPSRRRLVDVAEVRRHMIELFNQMWEAIGDLPAAHVFPDHPQTYFLFAGFSWREDRFRIWRVSFNPGLNRFQHTAAENLSEMPEDQTVYFAGDAVYEARQRLNTKLEASGRASGGGLDMEPFEVLRDMIREKAHAAIGGAPQLAKVYRHLNSQFLGVPWPNERGPITLNGRRALDFEAFAVPVIDIENPSAPPRFRAPAGESVGSRRARRRKEAGG